MLNHLLTKTDHNAGSSRLLDNCGLKRSLTATGHARAPSQLKLPAVSSHPKEGETEPSRDAIDRLGGWQQRVGCILTTESIRSIPPPTDTLSGTGATT